MKWQSASNKLNANYASFLLVEPHSNPNSYWIKSEQQPIPNKQTLNHDKTETCFNLKPEEEHQKTNCEIYVNEQAELYNKETGYYPVHIKIKAGWVCLMPKFQLTLTWK